MNPPLDPSSWGLVRFRLGTILVVLCLSHQTRVGLVQLGRLPERPMGADCKSVGLRLRRFESCTCHPGQRVFRPLWTGLGTGPVRSGSAVASAAASKAV